MSNPVEKLYGFRPNRWNKSTKLVIENNYFGPNAVFEPGVSSGVYNLFELNCSIADGSKFNNNTFVKESCYHNMINLYQVDSGTEDKHSVIEIKNNTFDCASECNPFRVGCKGAPEYVDIFVEGNTYTADENTEPEWKGLFFIQPYDKATEDLGGISIYLKDNVVPSDSKLFYYYAGTSQAQLHDLEETKLPNVYIWNDDLGDYVKVNVADYMDTSTYAREVAPLLSTQEQPTPEPTPETPTDQPVNP